MGYFKKQNPKLDKKTISREIDPLLYTDPDPEIYIITDSYNKSQISFIRKQIKIEVGRDVPFALIHSFIYKAKEPEIKKNVKSFISKYSVNYSKYIPKNSKIIVMGRSLFTIIEDTNLFVDAFYPLEFVENKFYYPDLNSWVFPTDAFYKLYSQEKKRPLDTWKTFFFKIQLKQAISFDVPSIRVPLLKRESVESPNKFLEDHMDEKEVAWDLETTGFKFFKDEIICITMSFDGKTGYYLDWSKVDTDVLNRFFKNKFQIGANLKFDCKFLRHRGVSNASIDFDTLNAGHILNEMRSNSLATHGWLYTYYGGHERELKKYLKKHPATKNYSQIPKETLKQYAIDDSIICFKIYEKMKKELEKDSRLNNYYYEHVVPNLKLFLEIEMDGVYVDWDLLKKIKKEFTEEVKEIEKKIFSFTGHPFKVTSKKDLGEILEEEMKFPDLHARAKESIGGYYLTGEEQLKEWSKRGYELADLLIKHREVQTFLDTFVGEESLQNAYWGYKNGNRVHPLYKVMLAQSHRNKCDSPNLQQVPKNSERARYYRNIFSPPSDKYFLCEGDYSGFQMRIAGVLSGDENLRKAFNEFGGDVHSVTTVKIFHPDWYIEDFIKVKNEHPYKEQRAIGKSTNFAFLFGGGAYSFTKDVIEKNWSRKQCIEFLEERNINWKDDPFLAVGTEIRNAFFRAYPKLKEWHEKSHKTAERDGCIYSVHGARRLFPQLLYQGKDDDPKEINKLYNQSKNSPVQDFEAVAIMRAMRELNAYYKENKMNSRLFGMIHDATQNYIHKQEKDILKKKIPEFFEKDYPEYDGIFMAYEMDLADPLNKEDSTVWGFGKSWY